MHGPDRSSQLTLCHQQQTSLLPPPNLQCTSVIFCMTAGLWSNDSTKQTPQKYIVLDTQNDNLQRQLISCFRYAKQQLISCLSCWNSSFRYFSRSTPKVLNRSSSIPACFSVFRHITQQQGKITVDEEQLRVMREGLTDGNGYNYLGMFGNSWPVVSSHCSDHMLCSVR